MPLLLAIESATESASVALAHGADVLAASAIAAGRPASESLLPAILAVLDEAGVALADLDAFAVSIGPGSFTGLRVGVATVKGLAFGGGQPVVPVPTLAALALRAARPDACVAALLDARRGEVYAALYRGDPAAPPQLAPAVLAPDALADAIERQAGDAPLVAVGAGVQVVADVLRSRFGGRLTLVGGAAGRPDAIAVARLGARLLASGRSVAADAIAPVYVRRAEAEVQRTGERFEA